MKAEIKGNMLIIELPLQKPQPSSSGKTLVVATTNGFVGTTAQVDGKDIKLSINAVIGR